MGEAVRDEIDAAVFLRSQCVGSSVSVCVRGEGACVWESGILLRIGRRGRRDIHTRCVLIRWSYGRTVAL